MQQGTDTSWRAIVKRDHAAITDDGKELIRAHIQELRGGTFQVRIRAGDYLTGASDQEVDAFLSERGIDPTRGWC